MLVGAVVAVAVLQVVCGLQWYWQPVCGVLWWLWQQQLAWLHGCALPQGLPWVLQAWQHALLVWSLLLVLSTLWWRRLLLAELV